MMLAFLETFFQHVTFADTSYVIMMYLGGKVFPLAACYGFVIRVLGEMYLIICKYTHNQPMNGLLWFKIRAQTSMISVQYDETCILFNSRKASKSTLSFENPKAFFIFNPYEREN